MTTSAPEHFDAVAERYAASEVHANSPTIRRLHELLGSKRLNSICDVACGPGHLALSFAGQASRIVGVDAAVNMLRHFESMAKNRSLKVATIQAYAEDIPLPSNSFDLVVSRLAPHHFSDPVKAIQEMVRLAKPGGSVAVIDLEGNEDPGLDGLNHEIEVLHDPTHVRSYTATRWRSFFEANGLVVTALESGHTELPGGLPISRWCEIGNTPDSAREQILTRLTVATREALAGIGIRRDHDEFRIPVRTLLVIGEKS